MADLDQNKIYIIPRNNFDNLTDEEKGSNVFFVRENSSETGEMLSLYLGAARQCDILDITEDPDVQGVAEQIYNPETDTWNLSAVPNKFKIPDKLLLFKYEKTGALAYKMFMWNSINNVFIVCGGSGDGGGFTPDNITIIANNGIIRGVGADISGKPLKIDGQSYTGMIGSHIYNDYDMDLSANTTYDNSVYGLFSNVFGTGEKLISNFSTMFGVGNDLSPAILSGGSGTPASSYSFISGYGNHLYGDRIFVFGSQNEFYQTVTPATGVSSNGYQNVYVFGDSNDVSKVDQSSYGMSNTYIFGNGNSHKRGSVNCYTFGVNNTTGSSLGAVTNVYTFGRELSVSERETDQPWYIIGRYNAFESCPSGVGITIGCGSASTSKKDSLISLDGNFYLDPNGTLGRDSHESNIISSQGTALDMIFETTHTGGSTSCTLQRLPKNNSQLYIKGSAQNVRDPIASITINTNNNEKFEYEYSTALGTQNYIQINDLSTGNGHDYSAIVTFTKDSSLTSASDIMTNFTADDESRIYLLNPDIDISNFTVINVLLFFDNLNMCAIVSGYQERPSA